MKETLKGGSGDIRAAVSKSLQEASGNSANLAELITQAITRGRAETAEVLAGLELIRQFSLTTASLIELRDQAVESHVKKQKKVTPKENGQPVLVQGEAKITTKTFAQLLDERIEDKLKPRQRLFTKRELITIGKKKQPVVKAIAAEGLPARQSKFSRQEAVRIISRVLTSARKDFDSKGKFTRSQLISRFHIPSKTLNDISTAIGYDWSKNQTVDAGTVLQIRGLAQLEESSRRKKR